MSQQLEHILDICIDQLKQGKTVEECLQQFPQYADKLRPMLQLAQGLEQMPKPEPSPAYMLSAALSLGRNQRIKKESLKSKFLPGNFFPMRRLSLAFNLVLVLLVLFWGMSRLSADSVPGEILYPVKVFTERVKFVLTIDEEHRAELRLTFAEERLQELSEIYQKNGQVDTGLIKIMLEEARLALDGTSVSPKKASLIFSKASHLNETQKFYLSGIQPRVEGATRQVIDEAIHTCNQRSQWMQQMMQQMINRKPMHNMMRQRCPMMRGWNNNENHP
jgi:hypothetical protein